MSHLSLVISSVPIETYYRSEKHILWQCKNLKACFIVWMSFLIMQYLLSLISKFPTASHRFLGTYVVSRFLLLWVELQWTTQWLLNEYSMNMNVKGFSALCFWFLDYIPSSSITGSYGNSNFSTVEIFILFSKRVDWSTFPLAVNENTLFSTFTSTLAVLGFSCDVC